MKGGRKTSDYSSYNKKITLLNYFYLIIPKLRRQRKQYMNSSRKDKTLMKYK